MTDPTDRSSFVLRAANPAAPKIANRIGKAKSVIFLFMEGGPSHIDLFDPKPLLRQLAGQKLPDSFGSVITAMGESKAPLLADKREWKQHGQTGRWVSSVFPHMAECVDDLAFLMAMRSKTNIHGPGSYMMNTGFLLPGFPCMGAWAGSASRRKSPS